MKNLPVRVGTAKFEPGKVNRGQLYVSTLPDGRKANIPVLAIQGNKTGPTCALITGAHGNEINGPETVKRFLDSLQVDKLRGALIVLPVMNVWGFKEKTREVMVDGQDLNRAFPGSQRARFSNRVANTIFKEVVALADFTIDVHDAGTKRLLLPHAIAHSTPSTDFSRELALAFGFDAIVLRKAKPGMLAGVARKKLKQTIITLEIGGAMRLWEPFQKRAVLGINNALKYMGMLPGNRLMPEAQMILERRHENPTEMSGLMTSWVNIGDVVTAGQPLYRIYDPISAKQIVHRARFCGIVIAKNVLAHVEKGEEGISIVRFNACRPDVTQIKGLVVKNKKQKGVRTFRAMLSQRHRDHQ